MKHKQSFGQNALRFISVLLSVALSLSLMPASALAVEPINDEQLTQDATTSEELVLDTDNQLEADASESALATPSEEASEESSDSLEAGLSDLVEFLYVDEEEVELGSDETIVVTFSQPIDAAEFILRYQKLGEDAIRSISSTNKTSDAASFMIRFADESELGDYRLIDISWDGPSAGVYEVPYAEKVHSFSVVRHKASAVDDDSDTTITTIDENGSLQQADDVSDALSISEDAVEANNPANVSAWARTGGNFVVALDPGHGGDDGGASANGVVEKYVNLKIAQYCRNELKEYTGVTVHMTRDSDVRPGSPTSVDLDNRVKSSIAAGADVFVSIHNNSAGAGAKGFEVYYQNRSWKPGLSDESKALAEKIQAKLRALGLTDRGVKIRNSENGSTYPGGGIADYYGLLYRCKEANIPALIVEHAFLTNPDDAAKLKDESFLRKLGVADAQAIAEYYGLQKGWWEKQSNGDWKYNMGNKGYATSTWMYIQGEWYYFNADGVMQTGFITLGGKTYYLGDNGAMRTGWQKVNGVWYYFEASGAAHSGWINLPDGWYYLDPQSYVMHTGWLNLGVYTFYLNPGLGGRMSTGLTVIDGKTYGFALGNAGHLIKGQWYYVDGADRYFLDDGSLASGEIVIEGTKHYFTDAGIPAQGWILVSGDWYYAELDGVAHKGWVKVRGNWFYLDPSDGKMAVGLVEVDGRKYYLHPTDGRMLTGWNEVDGKLHYFSSEGSMQKGWVTDGGERYYLDPEDGTMWIGKHEIDGSVYYFDGSGAMGTGIRHTPDGIYYFTTDGITLSGWRKDSGYWYYLNPGNGNRAAIGLTPVGNGVYCLGDDGRMLTDWQMINNEWYYFSYEGSMQKGWVKVRGNWFYLDPADGKMAGGLKEVDGRTYYLHPTDGRMLTGWNKIDGEWYYFSGEGSKQNGWVKVRGNWFYLDPADGKMAGGLKEVDGRTYYLHPTDGRMLTGWNKIDGKWYYFSGEGSMVKNEWIGQDWVGDDGVYDPNMRMMPIMGYSSITADKLAAIYNGKHTYPAFYENSDAPTAQRFFAILIEEANAEGVRADVVAAQSMLETGWLKFGNIVKIEQFNFAGIGALDGNAAGNCASFSSVREGLRAQVQHLKAYATSGSVPLNNKCVDPRFNLVTRGSAPYVEWLGINENPQGVGWASGKDYGTNIVNMIKNDFS